MAPQSSRRAPLGWQLARLAIGGSSRQAFLDQGAVSRALGAVPRRHRRALALRILSLSPHYFIYQWNGYPPELSRAEVLEAELERNRRSREQIAERLLAPLLPAEATVLDFGCGPGFLAVEVSRHVREVIAVDVSAGTLACARELNPGPSYLHAPRPGLPVGDAAVDAVYSVAVFQHIDPAEWPRHLEAIWRVLRPGGIGLCHFAIADGSPRPYEHPDGLRGRYSLRYEESTAEAVEAVLAGAGFADVRLTPTAELARIDDDVGRQHIATFRRPA